MHRIARGYADRIRRLDSVIPPAPPTTEEVERDERRSEQLADAALEGRDPAGLALIGDEHRVYAAMVGHARILAELVDEGLIDASGEPAGGPAPDDDLEDDDPLDGSEEGSRWP